MPHEIPVSRRLLLGAAMSLPWSVGKAAPATGTGGIVSLDFGLASTLLALGVTPAAISTRRDWKEWVVEPPMPDTVADLGMTNEINMEVLTRLKPSLVLLSSFLSGLRPKLEAFAPVREYSIYAEGREALDASIEATRDLGKLLEKESRTDAFLAQAEALFAECRMRLDRISPPPVALVLFLDERHARIFGGSGLYQGVLDRIGVKNAWQGTTSYWGFHTIALEELIALPEETRLVVFEPLMPRDVLYRLERSPLWRELPFVRAGRISLMPGVLMFGMVQEAMRFCRLLTDELERVA